MSENKEDAGGESGAQEPKAEERLDEDGLPLDRMPTLEDVRGGSGSGRTIAIGCTLFVLLALVGFWLIRVGILG